MTLQVLFQIRLSLAQEREEQKMNVNTNTKDANRIHQTKYIMLL